MKRIGWRGRQSARSWTSGGSSTPSRTSSARPSWCTGGPGSTTPALTWAWEHHARPHLGDLRLREVTPLTVARFRASLEAGGAGPETIRKTLTMLQSVFQCAVEWQLLEANPVRAARKPPVSRARAVPAIEPGVVEAMRADLRARGRAHDALLIVLLADAGLRSGEALGLEWRQLRSRTLLVEQRSRTGR